MTEGLQDRRRRQTEREIADAALALFEERGVDGTTVDDIARTAGVSARTVFRYASGKERAALLPHRDLEDRVALLLDSLRADAPLLPQLEGVWRESLVACDNGRSEIGQQLLRLRRLMRREPSLHLAAIGVDEERVDALVARLVDLVGRVDGEDEFALRILAETAASVVRTTLDHWADAHEAGGDLDLVATYDRACRELRRQVR